MSSIARSRALSPFSTRLTYLGLALLLATQFVPDAKAQQGVAASYTISPLGTISNPGSSAVVRRVNTLGEAVGGYKNGKPTSTSDAFIVSAAAGFDHITDNQVTDFSVLYGINDSGEIAGAINGPASVLPFRAVRHTGFLLLNLLNQDTSGAAYGINDQGEAAGFAGGVNGTRAVWWDKKGGVSELAHLQGSASTKALDINKKGDVVGYAGEATKTAVMWPGKGNVVVLENLTGYTSSQADSLNDAGDVVGSATAFDDKAVRIRAVLWPSGSSVPLDLGALPGGSNSRARDVDANGVVVGTSDIPNGNRAFIWSRATGITDLNSLTHDPSIVLIDALSVNKKGQILALGIAASDFVTNGDNEEHELPRQIVLLSPSK